MDVERQGPKEAVPDAYADHVRALRERAEVEKTGTLTLPATHLQAMFLVLQDVLKAAPELTAEELRVWNSIMRALGRAIIESS